MASQVIEIARQEGTEFRSVRLALEDDGTIKMDAQDKDIKRRLNGLLAKMEARIEKESA